MQLDPIKPTLKAPGSKRLKLQYDELLSRFAFKFKLRRYMVALENAVQEWAAVLTSVWRCRLTLSNPR